jgi:hypothetical protein
VFALAAAVAAESAAVLGNGHEGLAAGAVGLLIAAAGYAMLRTVSGLLASAVASLAPASFGSACGEPGPTGPSEPRGSGQAVVDRGNHGDRAG